MEKSERLFDLYIAVDWSARNVASPAKPCKDALWVGEKDLISNEQKESYFRTRFECLRYLEKTLIEKSLENKRVIIGYDLDFGFPAGFVDAIGLKGSEPKWKLIWEKLNETVKDGETNSNNRFDVANYLNSFCLEKNQIERGPLWGHPINQKHTSLFYKSPKYPFKTKCGIELRKFRWTESREPKAQPVWKLIGTASVGGQTIVGIPAIYKLRFHEKLKDTSKIWPFETGFNQTQNQIGTPSILHIEIWPGLLSKKLDPNIEIKDQAQVKATVEWLAENDESGELINLLKGPNWLTDEMKKDCIEEEGWVIGSGMREVKETNQLF